MSSRTPNPAVSSEREPYLSCSEIGAWLGLDESTVRDHAAGGILPATRIGGVWRFLESEIRAHLARHHNQRPRLVVPERRRPEPTTGRRLETGRR